MTAEQKPVQTAGKACARRLVAVVVTYNRLAQIRRTLEVLLAVPAAQLAGVLVVDCGSTDGTGAWLDGLDEPRLKVLRHAINLGGAGGFEAGLRHAVRDLAPDWVVLMDDDARPEPGAIGAFHALDRKGWDAIAGAAYHPDGTICEMNRPTHNPFWHPRILLRVIMGGGRGAFHLGGADYARTGLRQVDGASFVGLFLDARIFDQAGFPEGRLFLYGDDAIYTMRLTRAGYRIGFCPSVRFEHDSSTYSVHDRRIRPLWKVYYFYRNLLILYRQASGVFFLPVVLVYVPRWFARMRHHRGERRAYLRLLSRAVLDGVRGRIESDHASILAASESTPRR